MLPGERNHQHKEEKAKINTFFDSCKFDKKLGVKSPFKTMMEASFKQTLKKQEADMKGDGSYIDGPVQYDKKGRVKDPNVLYWFRTPCG